MVNFMIHCCLKSVYNQATLLSLKIATQKFLMSYDE